MVFGGRGADCMIFKLSFTLFLVLSRKSSSFSALLLFALCFNFWQC